VPVVATNDVPLPRARRLRVARDARLHRSGATLDDPSRARSYCEEQYLKSAEQMAMLFADLPEALANTMEIAKRCNLELDLGKECSCRTFAAEDGTRPVHI
jgi:DNA polymerase-3 subunit alpha